MTRQQIIQDALARFPELPLRAVARFVFHNHGPSFNNNLENIRSAIRYQVGANGDYNRKYHLEPRTSPVRMPETWRKTRVPHKLTPGLWLVMADIHIPFHEPKPLEAAMQYGKDAKVTGVLLLGDIQDCAAVSYWPSSMKRDFDKEIVLFVDFLDLLRREFPTQEIVYAIGNHEWRLPRYYESRCPELIGLPLAAFDTVLGLESRDIQLLDYRQMILAGKLPLFHGDEFRLSKAVNVARGLFLKAKSYALCAHGHQTSEHSERNIHGTLLTTWSLGCLCDLSPDYAPHTSWNWGCSLISVESNGAFEVLNRRILPNGTVV